MSIQQEPHYEIHSSELAVWLERQGDDSWWSVDGDPILMGRVSFPCPVEDLASALREIKKPLIILDKNKNADGRIISATELDRLADKDESGNRVFALSWKDQRHEAEWLLVEDRDAARVGSSVMLHAATGT